MTPLDIPLKPTLAQSGWDNFGQSPLLFVGVEENKNIPTVRANGIPASAIQSGNLTQQFVMADGYIQSLNFVTGVSGWQIKADGTREFN